MSYALSRPTPIQRSSLLAIAIALHAGILLLILATRTVAPTIVEMPLIVDLLPPPESRKAPAPDEPQTLQVGIDNRVFVGSEAVDRDSLESRFRKPVARYESVAETMSATRRAELAEIGFITQPGSDPR